MEERNKEQKLYKARSASCLCGKAASQEGPPQAKAVEA
jgi:hypothetical protein